MSYYDEVYAKCWTEDSIFCYKRGCNCSGCYMKNILESDICRLKTAVIELVRKFGAPVEKEENVFTESQQKIIDAIIEGCDSIEAIAKKLNKNESAITGMMHVLYLKEKERGWKPIKKGVITKTLLPQFIEWVKRGNDE